MVNSTYSTLADLRSASFRLFIFKSAMRAPSPAALPTARTFSSSQSGKSPMAVADFLLIKLIETEISSCPDLSLLLFSINHLICEYTATQGYPYYYINWITGKTEQCSGN